ncbi:zinc-binding dehydrogenase [Enterococcus faecium]
MAGEVLALVAEGKIKVPIAHTFVFSDLPSALTELEKEPPAGKFVV